VGGVFINYRAVDAPLGAAAIYAILVREFGQDQVFRDCESMKPGEHYPSALRAALERVDILIVVIGPQWSTLRGDDGARRIDGEQDWVRLEIHRAIQREIQIIPVLLTDLPDSPDGRLPKPEELPESIRALALKQDPRLSQRRFFTDVTALTDRVVELAPAMLIPRLFVKPAVLDERDRAPSVLLRPEHRVVPFAGRARELADLRSWATQPAALAAGLVTGSAGSGRTRLAMELCDSLVADGWLAGIVDGDAPSAQISQTVRMDKPLLAVIDDVEIRYDQLVSVAEAIVVRASAQPAPARLLLLGGSGTEWLSRLRSHRNPEVAALFETVDDRSTFPVGMAGVDAEGQYRAACAAFAAKFGVAEPASPPLGIASLGSLLRVHAVALDGVLSGRGGPADPLRRVTDHDRRHWRRRIRDDGAAQLRTTTMSVVSALVTLCRPTSESQAEALAVRLDDLARVPREDVAEYREWYQRLYPGRQALSPIGPGPYGNLVIAAAIAAEPWIPANLARVGTQEQIGNALTVLGRAVPEQPSLRAAITELLATDPDRLVRLAAEVADRLEDPEPFVRTVAGVLEASRLRQETVVWLMDRVAMAPRRHLDPLRSVLVSIFPAEFKEIFRTLGPQHVPPQFAPFQKMLDVLESTAHQFVQNFFDPEGRPAPTGPDGKPLVPPELLRMYRTFLEWQRRGPGGSQDR
jgi:TIR domain